MNTIKNNITKELIIKNSKFITILERFDDEKEIKNKINYYKDIYPNATHYCYAYIVGNKMHYSDDGEPSGTAGNSIYNVINKNNLNNVLCTVIRYFGGIKLGANGLIRAYGKAAKVFDKDDLIELKSGIRIIITFDYASVKLIDNLIKNAIKVECDYKDDITYELLIANDYFDIVKNDIARNAKNVSVKENVFITK
jgi:uncharacterized YigZ family protein